MTKKDYELLAKRFKWELEYHRMMINGITTHQSQIDHAKSSIIAIHSLVNDLADDLSQDNPRFNRAKFLQACGYND